MYEELMKQKKAKPMLAAVAAKKTCR